MPDVEQTLIRFFESVARKDKDELQRLRQQRQFRVEQGRWCFTLPDLHFYLQRYEDAFSGVSYKRFRQLIFNSAINQAINPYGAEITIADNRAKVDQSVYALAWQTRRYGNNL